ncbi:MAG: YtxH domain-containing protein [Balneolaceae bacterium]
MNRSIEALLTTVVGFTTGIVIGLLLSPKSGKENRKWVSEHTGEAKNWVENRGGKLVKESEHKLGRITKGVKKVIPDLYEATSNILFEEEELEENA